jgi:hypothetical protein
MELNTFANGTIKYQSDDMNLIIREYWVKFCMICLENHYSQLYHPSCILADFFCLLLLNLIGDGWDRTRNL